jgi:ribonuclease HI
LNRAPLLLEAPPRIIYCDGGTAKNGVSAAAITIHRGVRPNAEEEHSLYVPVSTNNVCEYVALIGALNYIKRKNDGVKTLIIVDSELVYKQVMAKAVCHTSHLKYLHQQAISLRSDLDVNGKLLVAHMLRGFGNKADPLVARTRAAGRSLGDSTLFPTPPDVPPPRAQVAPVPVTDCMSALEHVHLYIKSPQDFIRLRQLKTRSFCPQSALPNWAVLVRETLTRLVYAKTNVDAVKAFKTFMLLPTVFLPVSSSTTYVVNNILAGRPYNVRERLDRLEGNLNQAQQSPPPLASYNGKAAAAAAAAQHPTLEHVTRATRTPEERLAATVRRLVLDGKLRSAVKIMQQESITGDIDFDTKVANLRKKFVPRRGQLVPLQARKTLRFARELVKEVVQNMSRNASTCIDGWTKDLLWDAIEVDGEIADLIGAVCASINNGEYPEEMMELIRMGRLVGIPKPEGGVRPIVISSFLAKLTGACVLRSTKVKCAKTQFAVGKPQGAVRVVHLARAKYREGKAIIRIDSTNAFNIAPRVVVARALMTSDAPPELKAYFNAMYMASSKLAVYGPDGRFETIESEEGVRQGDAASTLLFCKVMDVACAKLKAAHPSVSVWSYVDDLTIACEPTAAKEVANCIADILLSLGFEINMTKSAVTAKSHDLISLIHSSLVASPIRIEPPDTPFKMLGSIINEDQCNPFLIEKSVQIEKFVTKLFNTPIAAQLKWTILRLCGAPKLQYVASSLPPAVTEKLLEWFDAEMKRCIERILDADVLAQHVHDVEGANFPCYSKLAPTLYEETSRLALCDSDLGGDAAVLNTTPHTDGVLSQKNASFMLFKRLHPIATLTDDEFILATCIRLKTLPRSMDFPRVCSCRRQDAEMTTAEQFINHALSCKQLSSYSQTTRHNLVRDTLAAVARMFGISTTIEPTFYAYSCTSNPRPDIVFHLPRAVATDVSVVFPVGEEGESTRAKAKSKTQRHQPAVTALNHEFIPFVLDTFGTMDKGCKELIVALKRQVPIHLKSSFDFHAYHSISCALAKARAATIRAVKRV